MKLRGLVEPELDALAGSLPAEDALRADLGERGQVVEDLLLRYLRHNSLDSERAAAQFRSFVQWRSAVRTGCVPASVMRGAAGGCPVVLIPELGNGRTTLLFTSARHYVKRECIASAHDKAVVRVFESLLYARDGARATAALAIVDFEGVSLSQVDLPAMKRDVQVFMSYYPETFHRLLFVAYPSFIHSFWQMVRRLLDERTRERIVWCESRGDVTKELCKYFTKSQVPTWLGGESSKYSVDVLSGVQDAKALQEELTSKYTCTS